jgi:hypothetical protein
MADVMSLPCDTLFRWFPSIVIKWMGGGKKQKVRPEGYEKWTSHKKKELGARRAKGFQV